MGKNKLLPYYFVVIMLTLLMCACSSHNNDALASTSSVNIESSTREVVSETELGADVDPTVNSESVMTPTEETHSEPTDQYKQHDFEQVILDAENLYPVLIDEEGIRASVRGYSYANGKSVYELNLLFENNSDEELSIVLTDVIIDGFDISTSYGKILVAPGHKAICDSSIWEKKILEAGIETWMELEGNIIIKQGYYGDKIYIVPVRIDKNCWEIETAGEAQKPIITSSPSDTIIIEDAIVISKDNLRPVVYSQDDMSVAIQSFKYANAKTVFEINMTFDNQTEKDLFVYLTDVVVNGFDISTSSGKSKVESGHKAICDSSVWKKNMTPLDIGDWEYLSGKIIIKDGFWGERIVEVPVVIYKNAWESA